MDKPNPDPDSTLINALGCCTAPWRQLETLYLEHNPVQAAPDYMAKLLALVPSLTQIDATPISRR